MIWTTDSMIAALNRRTARGERVVDEVRNLAIAEFNVTLVRACNRVIQDQHPHAIDVVHDVALLRGLL